ncbi:MAG: DUF5676 family membrane protein [Patescibacteria group bacterium]
MKLDKIVLANAFALVAAVLWVVCSAIVWLLPELSLSVTRWLVHGLNIGVLGSWNLNLSNLLLGGITLIASMWVIGWVFGWAWEKMSKK